MRLPDGLSFNAHDMMLYRNGNPLDVCPFEANAAAQGEGDEG